MAAQGDEQFRVFCRLKPGTREIIEKSREFKFGEENTVYHVGYPYSYRQAGKVPNIQFSISEDGLRADIDVDYRSSKIPAAMWNGHLSSANSDVRAGDNYKRHNNRWAGLVNWWSAILGKMPEETEEQAELLAKEPPEPATPLPPNRPPGAQIAEVWDATQELLTDWLVRRNDEALEFVSDQALACAKLDDGTDPRTLTAAEARRRLQQIMKVISSEIGRVANLTQAIDAGRSVEESVPRGETAIRRRLHDRRGSGWLCRTLPLREPFQRATASCAVGREPALRDLLWGSISDSSVPPVEAACWRCCGRNRMAPGE